MSVGELATPYEVRVIPIDIYDYAKELKILSQLKSGSCVGIVSLSSGILRGAEVIVNSLRGDELLLMTTQSNDRYKLQAIARSANLILCDQASFEAVKQAIKTVEDELIRMPQVICCENYIHKDSIDHLRRELGLT